MNHHHNKKKQRQILTELAIKYNCPKASSSVINTQLSNVASLPITFLKYKYYLCYNCSQPRIAFLIDDFSIRLVLV